MTRASGQSGDDITAPPRIPFLQLNDSIAEIREELDAAYTRVMARGQFILGDETAAFEREFAAYCGATHAVGVGNGLDALTLSLRGLGIGAGDEVIVPAHTFIATWLAVTATGAMPVPVEPDSTTFNIDADRVQAAITPRTAAIVPVHLYGQCADMATLGRIAHAGGIPIVADAAQAAGATFAGQAANVIGRAAAFSFYPSKNLGAFGDGGAVVTSDDELAETVRRLRNYGSAEKGSHELQGCNSRLDELQAAFLRCRLAHLPQWNARRRELANRYMVRLAAEPRLILPRVAPGTLPVWHLFTVRVPNGRDSLKRYLHKEGVESRIYYPVLPHLTPAYASDRTRFPPLPMAQQLAKEILSLPLHPHLSDDDVDHICELVFRWPETGL
jgi:dTDP-3-amino-3,4,6-trideoxy-alpha-D-glucose transaminase